MCFIRFATYKCHLWICIYIGYCVCGTISSWKNNIFSVLWTKNKSSVLLRLKNKYDFRLDEHIKHLFKHRITVSTKQFSVNVWRKKNPKFDRDIFKMKIVISLRTFIVKRHCLDYLFIKGKFYVHGDYILNKPFSKLNIFKMNLCFLFVLHFICWPSLIQNTNVYFHMIKHERLGYLWSSTLMDSLGCRHPLL